MPGRRPVDRPGSPAGNHEQWSDGSYRLTLFMQEQTPHLQVDVENTDPKIRHVCVLSTMIGAVLFSVGEPWKAVLFYEDGAARAKIAYVLEAASNTAENIARAMSCLRDVAQSAMRSAPILRMANGAGHGARRPGGEPHDG